MWAHRPTCGCSVCNCLPRIFQLIACEIGQNNYQTFVDFAAHQLRNTEAELRDEISRRRALDGRDKGVCAAPPAPPSENQAPPTSQACGSGEELPQGLQTTPKGAPPPRPPQLSGSAPTEEASQVKEEQKESQAEGSAAPEAESPPRASGVKDRSRPREKRRSTSEKAKGERRSPSVRDKDKRRSRDRSRRRRRSTSRGHRSQDRGREKKRRTERPPEPVGPPPGRVEDLSWGPHEPSYPPPPRQGPGWKGEIPRSDHPRWHKSENKGVVKRAKQELFNRRQQGRK